MRSAGPYAAVAASGLGAQHLIKFAVGVAVVVVVNVLTQVRLPAVIALYVGIGFVVLLRAGRAAGGRGSRLSRGGGDPGFIQVEGRGATSWGQLPISQRPQWRCSMWCLVSSGCHRDPTSRWCG